MIVLYYVWVKAWGSSPLLVGAVIIFIITLKETKVDSIILRAMQHNIKAIKTTKG